MKGPRSNGWNRMIYTLWSPVYDLLVGLGPLARARRQGIDLLALQAGEEVLLAGVVTGADLSLLGAGVKATGVDLSAAMLAMARRKLPVEGCEVTLEQADVMNLPFEDERFDAAILTLILSVVRDEGSLFSGAYRAILLEKTKD